MAKRINARPWRSHDEATIESFARDREFAVAYLEAVLKDGDAAELRGALARIVRAMAGEAATPGAAM